jgi:transcriptional regulator with XRE-family HTH domain
MPIPKKGPKTVNAIKPVSMMSKNLRYLMSKNRIDAATLCAATQLAAPTINSLRRGVGNPTLSTVFDLANYFEVSLGDLMERDLSVEEVMRAPASLIPLIKINEINRFLENKLEAVGTYTTEIDEYDAASCFAVLVNNDSLHPQFSPNTVLIISRDAKPRDNDIALIKINDHHPCFRRIFINENHLLFSSISIESEPSLFQYENYELIGILLRAIKTISER